MKMALLMLGSLTLPSLISPASPARTWAWLRYFLAITNDDDFRITRDFSDLDPHLKTILSDDLGVALSTQWLFDRLGGFQDIVHGRSFMLQFPHRLKKRANAPTAKVGPSKAPDYVVLDKTNKWHVLECKGTQSGAGARDGYLTDALSQKQVILLNDDIRGERLAAGLSISHEDRRRNSSLRVIDPEVDPILTLESSDAREIKSKVRRLSVARALGMIGLNESSMELSLPPDVSEARDYLKYVERHRVRETTQARSERASDELKSRDLEHFTFGSKDFEGRTITINLPGLVRGESFDTLVVRQGVDRDLLQELASVSSLFGDDIDTRIDTRLSDAVVEMVSDGTRVILKQGELFFAELILKRRT
ncbi:hypothetical protein I6F09_14280 [Bradyrhizobium sp. IC3195]|uniref:hypothetical protein n=1 Tax=Bradyrhizobium sp. IC3195 TaxID=2793804 RepID=UPI001CD1BCB2|nr:hypothetical protein [Bradyrhizobium sp. IC3195]MCA1469064.1 hypothetical protein [Bradyrhizobium sp. IC3195]